MKKFLYSLYAFIAVMFTSTLAFAQEAAAGDSGALFPQGAVVAFAIGLAALAGTLSQGRTASAALEGIARNPQASGQIFVPMILGLAFIESLVILTWLMQFTFGG